MSREDALRLLAPAHAVALRLDAAGAGHDVIGQALEIPAEAVPQVLEIARLKLAQAIEDQSPDGSGSAVVDVTACPPGAEGHAVRAPDDA